jgi:hypothetical protein
MLSRSSPISEPAQGIRLLVADRNRMGSQLLAASLARDPRFEIVAVASATDLILRQKRGFKSLETFTAAILQSIS